MTPSSHLRLGDDIISRLKMRLKVKPTKKEITVLEIAEQNYPHPFITCPKPTENVNGFCPASFVLQNISLRLPFFP
jgi:hypothetical protein